MRSRERLLTLTSVVLFLASCTSKEKARTHTFRIYEEDGVTIAETTGGPKYGGELFTYEKMMALDTGQSEETLLYRPSQFLADEFGNLYVNDMGKGSILVFNTAGRYLRSIGRKGQGPGEFSGGQIELIHEGVIQFFDPIMQRRTTRYRTDGTFIDITTLPIGVGLLGATGYLILPDETRLVLIRDSNTADMGETQRRGAVVISAASDTLGLVRTPWIRVGKKIEITMRETVSIAAMPLAYGPLPMALYHPNHGIVLSMSIRPELEIYDLSGHRTRTIRIELDPEPVSELDKDKSRQILLQNAAESSEVVKRMVEAQVKQMQFAEQKAFWGVANIDDDGYFWLDLSLPPAIMTGDTHNFRVLSPEGEYLGITSRPYGTGAVVSHGRLLILEEDPESGEVLPTVYRILPAVEGLEYPD